MAPTRVIIDTDPGVDDILALLLALSSSPEELEICMISITYGNVPLQNCMKNIVALFHVIEKDQAWREENGRATRFETMKVHKPIVAVGPSMPLENDELMADYAHGLDGLHGIHEKLPQLSPVYGWHHLFKKASHPAQEVDSQYPKNFIPSKEPAHKEILRLLRESPTDSITVIALGPLTSLALAAAEDPKTFLKAKEVVVMGGAIFGGNITPVAEFNAYADPVATARVFALTSPDPQSVMPPILGSESLPPYPTNLWRKLKLTLTPLNITKLHLLSRGFFIDKTKQLVDSGSPLAIWINGIMDGTFNWSDHIRGRGKGVPIHDALTIWYVLTSTDPTWETSLGEDIRIETGGQWTQGMYILDTRDLKKPKVEVIPHAKNCEQNNDGLVLKADKMGWYDVKRGNRINRLIKSPGEDVFASFMLDRIFS